MKATAFLNLPVQAGCLRVVNLHAIDAEVVLLRDWMFGVNQRKRDEWPAVFVPRREHGKLIEMRRRINDISDRRAWRFTSP